MKKPAAFCFTFLFLAAGSSVQAQTIHQSPDTLHISSVHLNDTRTVWVQKPPGYDTLKQKIPLLVVLDADAHFNLAGQFMAYLQVPWEKAAPPVLLAGLPSRQRNFILTPVTGLQKTDTMSSRGGAEKYLSFIEQELIPELEKKYNINSFRILAGHSLGGLFALYTMHKSPNLFSAIIAASPSVSYGESVLLRQYLPAVSAQAKGFPRFLYFTVSDNDLPGYASENEKLKNILSEKPVHDLHWQFQEMQGYTHWTTAPATYYKGLIELFRWKATLTD